MKYIQINDCKQQNAEKPLNMKTREIDTSSSSNNANSNC